MIQYIEGDIFESPAKVIVNTVNTVGVMGKGLALSFKQRYPQMFEKYKITCEKNLLTIGKLMLFYEPDHWILLFPTKENWRYPSKLEYIEKGLMKFVSTYAEKNITSIAFPRLGCGNGELNWQDVKPLMEKYLKHIPIDVYIYLGTNPDIVPEHKEPKKTLEWLKKNAKDMSFNGVKDDLFSICSMLPYEFQLNDKKMEMASDNLNELQITEISSGQQWSITEDELFKIWDYVRTECIFADNTVSEKYKIVYGILYSTGYLSKVKIYDPQALCKTDGYQINSGLGRVHTLQEN